MDTRSAAGSWELVPLCERRLTALYLGHSLRDRWAPIPLVDEEFPEVSWSIRRTFSTFVENHNIFESLNQQNESLVQRFNGTVSTSGGRSPDGSRPSYDECRRHNISGVPTTGQSKL